MHINELLRKNLLTENSFQRKNVIILGDMVRKRRREAVSLKIRCRNILDAMKFFALEKAAVAADDPVKWPTALRP